jgi:hypothetical protein
VPPRVFLLSPARLDGVRASTLFRPRRIAGLAARLRTIEGAPIGEVFAFLSGLYFRGKLTYAKAFARPPGNEAGAWMGSGALVITANRGLVPAETRVCLEHLEAFASTDIHAAETTFTKPLLRDAKLLGAGLGDQGEAVLLGSVATAKYVAPLEQALGERLLFPRDFAGRGDMSRGGLLLRAASEKTELVYATLKDAPRHGARPPKLAPR